MRWVFDPTPGTDLLTGVAHKVLASHFRDTSRSKAGSLDALVGLFSGLLEGSIHEVFRQSAVSMGLGNQTVMHGC